MSDLTEIIGPFNPNEHEDLGFDPLPPGEYNAIIDKAEVKSTKAGDGYILKLEMSVFDGQYARRKLFANINIKNPNPTAQQIGQAQLAALCKAIGLATIEDSQQLVNQPVTVKVKVVDNPGRGKDNDVSGYKAYAGASQSQSQANSPQQHNSQPSASTANQQAPGGGMPWAK